MERNSGARLSICSQPSPTCPQAVAAPEKRAIADLRSVDPSQVCFDRAESGQRRRLERRFLDLPISLRDRKITGHALSRHNLHMLST